MKRFALFKIGLFLFLATECKGRDLPNEITRSADPNKLSPVIFSKYWKESIFFCFSLNSLRDLRLSNTYRASLHRHIAIARAMNVFLVLVQASEQSDKNETKTKNMTYKSYDLAGCQKVSVIKIKNRVRRTNVAYKLNSTLRSRIVNKAINTHLTESQFAVASLIRLARML